MHAVYLACLFGGLVATVLFAALGALGGIAGHGAGHLHVGHTHAGHLPTPDVSHAHGAQLVTHATPGQSAPTHGASAAHGHVGAHGNSTDAAQTGSAWAAAALGWTLSWVNPLNAAAAALWFGGVGLLAEALLPGLLALPLAVAAGLLGAALVRSLMAAFVRASSAPLHADAVGALGTINAAIRADAAGEVIYTLEGLRRSAAARSVDGRPIPRGASVVIVRRERGMAWVQALDPLDTLGSTPQAALPERGATPGDVSPP